MNKDVNPFKNGYKQPASIAVMALLVFGVAAVVLASAPRSAFAAVDISSSSDRFYGPAMVRVLITDTSKDTALDTINPHIEAKRGSTVLATSDPSIGIIGTSGTFELFLTTSNSTLNPLHSTFDPTTPANAYVGRINSNPSTNAHDFPMTLGTGEKLKDGDTIVITYGGQTKTIQFAKTNAVVTLDRSVAGQNNFVTVTLNDQDANIDPTAVDTITANQTYITATGGTLNFNSSARFLENGQNSHTFDLIVNVTTASSGGSPTGGASLNGADFPSSASFTVNDHDVYTGGIGTAPYDVRTPNSAVTSSQSITLRNTDGILTLTSPVSIGNGINIQITDQDRNVDSKSKDTFTGKVAIKMNTTSGVVLGSASGYTDITFKETDFNSGIFLPDLTDNSISISATTGNSGATSGGIAINATTLADDPDLYIIYTDPASDPSGSKTFQIATKITHVQGTISGSTQVTPNGKFSLTITDNDLNTNTDTADSFVVTYNNSTNSGTHELTFQSGLGGITLKVRNSGITTFSTSNSFTMSFIETGANTGIFTASNLDMAKINNALSTTLKDGDQVEFKYFDHSESSTPTSTATVTIGKPPVSIDVDRSTVPIPGTSATNGVKFTVTVTDQQLDSNPTSVDSVSLGSDTPSGTNNLEVAVTDKSNSALATGHKIGGLDPTSVDVLAPATFTETGANTGIFTHTYTIFRSGATIDDLDNGKIKFTYTSSSGTTTSISVTTRSYDGAVTASQSTVKNGDIITITVTEPDLNLDSTSIEQAQVKITATNDDVSQGSNNTRTISDLKETGPNTGIFTKNIQIGKDVLVSDLTNNNFASELEIHYTDALATDLSTGVDRELDLTVGTTTGTITTTPDIVGPGTKMYIQVHDSDLNQNPLGVDTAGGTGVDYLKITSNQTGTSIFSGAKGEETGANTGVFQTKLTLSPRSVGTKGVFAGADSKEITGTVLPGDLISIKYTDQSDASGKKVTVSKVIQVVSVDPEIKINKDNVGAGDSIIATVSDADANIDGDAVDTIQLTVTSTTDPVGIKVTGLETGPNTGVFTASIPTTTGVTTGSVSVKSGDTLTVKYNDKYPADYNTRVRNVADPSKDFYFTVQLGGRTGTVDSTTPAPAAPSDLSGQAVSEVKANQQVLLTSKIHNNQDSTRNFVAIIEVFNANGEVVKIGISGGQLAANGDSPVGTDFTADASGTYKVKIFVLSDLGSPTILATPSEMNLTVS